MIQQVFKKSMWIMLFGVGAAAGLVWSKLPMLNVEPPPCQDKVFVFGEVKSCPPGMRLELAGTEDRAYVICQCPNGERRPSTMMPELPREPPHDDTPTPVKPPLGTYL